MVYRVDRSSNTLIELDETTFSGERISELAHIEEWVRKNPKLLCDADEDIKIISKQQVYETRKRSDLVGVDDLGQIVIIELKRDFAEPMDEFQAIRYASSYLNSTYDDVCKIYASYLEENKAELEIDENQDFLAVARSEIENLCSQNIKIPDDFNKNQRIVLVSREFSKHLLSAVSWLILKGIKVKCIELTPHKYNEDLFILPKTILPTLELAENIVGVRQAEEKVRQDKQRATYRIWEGPIEYHYDRLSPPLGEHLERLVSEVKRLGVEPTALSGSGFHLVKGDRKVMVSTWIKSKIEFRFPRTTKEDLEGLLQNLGITSFKVKPKADFESYGLQNPTASIDYKPEINDFEDIIRLCEEWLGIR